MLTIRIRSANGTRRLNVDEQDLLSTLSQRIRREYSNELKSQGFKLWREGDVSRADLLSAVEGAMSFRELGIRQGEMLYLETTEKAAIPVHVEDIQQTYLVQQSRGTESSHFNHVAIYRRIRDLMS
ncbi:hypothetical protein NCC49_002623 [Naganishia albida]|nr:hypothetical protein NCC49_002623 [Naganishia albida]